MVIKPQSHSLLLSGKRFTALPPDRVFPFYQIHPLVAQSATALISLCSLQIHKYNNMILNLKNLMENHQTYFFELFLFSFLAVGVHIVSHVIHFFKFMKWVEITIEMHTPLLSTVTQSPSSIAIRPNAFSVVCSHHPKAHFETGKVLNNSCTVNIPHNDLIM